MTWWSYFLASFSSFFALANRFFNSFKSILGSRCNNLFLILEKFSGFMNMVMAL